MLRTLVLDLGKKYGRIPPEPDDCPECKGVRGFEEAAGCMGGTHVTPCKMCDGRGKLSKGELELHHAMAIHDGFKKKIIPKYAEIVDAARRYVHGKREYRNLLDTGMTPPSDYYRAIEETTAKITKGKADLIRLVDELDALESAYDKALGK